MDAQKSFHMAEGDGETSYAKNSSLQRKGSKMIGHIAVEAIQQLYLKTTPTNLIIADLGCGSGTNSLSAIKDLCHAVQEASGTAKQTPPPELVVYLNDLPTNDFNSIFKALPGFRGEPKRDQTRDHESAFDQISGETFIPVAAFPGSFYSRVFPRTSVHFIYSCLSLHWLSKIPPAIYDEKGESMNKGSIYITKNSPPSISEAYLKQFQEDFSTFLRLRSQELVEEGRMVLSFLGRKAEDHIDRGNSMSWQVLTESFVELINKGHVEQQKLDSYDVHFYAPSKVEIEEEVRKEGSFIFDRLEMLRIETHQTCSNGMSHGMMVARATRAVQGSMISHHFGEEILDPLFEIYARMMDEEVSKEPFESIIFALVLTKKMRDYR